MKDEKEKKHVPFVKEMHKALMPVNILAGSSIFIFVSFSIILRSSQWIPCLIFLAALVTVAEGVVAPLFHNAITKKLSIDVEKWRRGEMNENERMALFENMMAYPTRKKGVEAWIIFTFAALGYVFACHFIPQIRVAWSDLRAGFLSAIYGSYFAFLANVLTAETICNKYGKKIIKSGVVVERLMKNKTYGISVALRGVLYVVIPIIFSISMMIMFILQAYKMQNAYYVSGAFHMYRIIGFMIFWISVVFLSLAKTASETMKNNVVLCSTIDNILTFYSVSTDSKEILADTNLNGKMQYNIFLLNQLVSQFQKILMVANKTNVEVRNMAGNLSVVASELASTSIEQSADIKEIIGTMEDANKLSNVIREHVQGVTDGADKTKDDVGMAEVALSENHKQIESIYNSYKDIITNIRNLGNQVENIDDVAAIIRNISDQTQIIAFNAELEAVGAGDDGRNFHIVAAETRRLASSTMESISNIQEYIGSIKEAAKMLISSAESQTMYIQEEMQTIRELVSHFDSIKNGAEHTLAKSVEIESIVEQQVSSFNQIVITLRQIGAGVESFTGSAQVISNAASEIQNVAGQLEQMQ